jgi:opacity protein-like surface antigen
VRGEIALAAFCLLAPATVRAQNAPARWELSLSARGAAAPSGWVQVREGDIEGTRLALRHDLGVRSTQTYELGAAYHLSDRTALRLSVLSNSVRGRVTLPSDVVFNGATLAGGSPLVTRTDFPNFMRVTLAGEHRFATVGGSGTLSGSAGLTFVLLTFELRGTLAPGTTGRETKEDFVTQELPTPIIGLRLEYPIAGRLSAISSVAGGFLPWINSFRSEGGTVSLKQSHLDMALGLGYQLTRSLRLDAGYSGSRFAQFERSQEDGNFIRLGEDGVRVGVVWR